MLLVQKWPKIVQNSRNTRKEKRKIWTIFGKEPSDLIYFLLNVLLSIGIRCTLLTFVPSMYPRPNTYIFISVTNYTLHVWVLSILLVEITQCGNFRICLSLRFYMKSTLENVHILKTAAFALFEALNWVNFSLQKLQKFIIIKIQSL